MANAITATVADEDEISSFDFLPDAPKAPAAAPKAPAPKTSAAQKAAAYAAEQQQQITFIATIQKLIYSSPETAWGVAKMAVVASDLERVLASRPAGAVMQTASRYGYKDPANVVSTAGLLATTTSGVEMEITGTWTVDKKYGPQVKISASRLHGAAINAKTEKESIRRILMSFAGVGWSTADEILIAFKNDGEAISADLDAGCPRIATLCTEKVLAGIQEGWSRISGDAEALAFLYDLGLGPALASRILATYKHKQWNAKMIREKITRNPYRLIDEFRGIAFLSADKIAIKLGTGLASPFRKAAAAKHIIEHASQDGGHTVVARSVLMEQSLKLIGQTPLPLHLHEREASIISDRERRESGASADDADRAAAETACRALSGNGHPTRADAAGCILCQGTGMVPSSMKWMDRVEVWIPSIWQGGEVNADAYAFAPEQKDEDVEIEDYISRSFRIIRIIRSGEVREAVALTTTVKAEMAIAAEVERLLTPGWE